MNVSVVRCMSPMLLLTFVGVAYVRSVTTVMTKKILRVFDEKGVVCINYYLFCLLPPSLSPPLFRPASLPLPPSLSPM